MPQRYAALRFIGGLYKVLAVIAAGLTVLGVLGFATMTLGGAMFREVGRVGMMGGLVGGMLGGIALLVYGSFISVTLFAASQPCVHGPNVYECVTFPCKPGLGEAARRRPRNLVTKRSLT